MAQHTYLGFYMLFLLDILVILVFVEVHDLASRMVLFPMDLNQVQAHPGYNFMPSVQHYDLVILGDLSPWHPWYTCLCESL